MFTVHIYLVYIYKPDLVLNSLRFAIKPKQTNQILMTRYHIDKIKLSGMQWQSLDINTYE